MKHIDLEITHILPNRMRLHLPDGISNIKTAEKYICSEESIYTFSYNKVIKTALVTFDSELTKDKVLTRIATLYSMQNELKNVHIKDCTNYGEEKVTPSGTIALLGIITNTAIQLSIPTSYIATITKWCAVGTTAGAVIEHAYHELSDRGSFDPEVMSIMYLLDSIGKGQTIYSTPLVWILVFGRHLFSSVEDGIIVKIKEENCLNQEKKYKVYVLKEVPKHGKVNFFGEFFNKYINNYQRMNLMSRGTQQGLFNKK